MLAQNLPTELPTQLQAVESFEEHVKRLRKKVLELGRMVEEAIVGAVAALHPSGLPVELASDALVQPNVGSQSLITLDHRITTKRFAIELDCVTLIATQRPEADDLRAVVSMLEIATELEHIGDYLSDVAQIHFMIVRVDPSLLGLLGDIQHMSAVMQRMLRQALDALAGRDLGLAKATLAQDDEIDLVHSQVYQALLAFIQDKPHKIIRQARYLTQIARHLERAADRVTNICEWVIFAITGELAPR